MVLVRNDMTYRIRDDLMNNEIQTIWVELIRKNSKNIVIGGVYRTWSSKDYDKDLKEIADKWKGCLASCGLKIENMGLTWRSHGIFNGKK